MVARIRDDDYSEARWLRFLPVFGQKVGGFSSRAPNFLSLLRKGASNCCKAWAASWKSEDVRCGERAKSLLSSAPLEALAAVRQEAFVLRQGGDEQPKEGRARWEPKKAFELARTPCGVGATGFEPATPWSQTRCATNCATPRGI